ncbi:MAG: c-type cytochrome [Acidobacteriota bacterium]
MKKLISWLAIAAVVGVTGLGAVQAADGPDGKALYNRKCALCHGKDGAAKKMAKGSGNFNDAAWQKATSLEAIIKQIEEGKGKMKAYKEKLSAAEIEAIAHYVKTLG